MFSGCLSNVARVMKIEIENSGKLLLWIQLFSIFFKFVTFPYNITAEQSRKIGRNAGPIRFHRTRQIERIEKKKKKQFQNLPGFLNFFFFERINVNDIYIFFITREN